MQAESVPLPTGSDLPRPASRVEGPPPPRRCELDCWSSTARRRGRSFPIARLDKRPRRKFRTDPGCAAVAGQGTQCCGETFPSPSTRGADRDSRGAGRADASEGNWSVWSAKRTRSARDGVGPSLLAFLAWDPHGPPGWSSRSRTNSSLPRGMAAETSRGFRSRAWYVPFIGVVRRGGKGTLFVLRPHQGGCLPLLAPS